jgi:integrase
VPITFSSRPCDRPGCTCQWLLALMCGLRSRRQHAPTSGRRECGLRYKAPKSDKARTVALSSTVIAELKAHRARQAEEQLRLGLRPDGDSFVVAQVDGSPLQPRSLTHEWMRIIQLTALPRVRFHDLRHTHATQLLAAGVHPKVAQERLGHSTIAVTLDLYSHVMPGMHADAAEQVDGALRRAISGGSQTK